MRGQKTENVGFGEGIDFVIPGEMSDKVAVGSEIGRKAVALKGIDSVRLDFEDEMDNREGRDAAHKAVRVKPGGESQAEMTRKLDKEQMKKQVGGGVVGFLGRMVNVLGA